TRPRVKVRQSAALRVSSLLSYRSRLGGQMKNFFRRPRDRSDTSTRGLRQRRGSARNQLSACALALASLTNAGPAAAQHCHHLQPNEPGKIGLSVGLASEFATYRNA